LYTFDGENRIISLDPGVTSFGVIDLYSKWKEWVIVADNAKYPKAFFTIGGEPINSDGSQVISPYFFLDNLWKVRPQETDHELVILGNLLTPDGAPPTVATIGGFSVYVRTVLSVNSTTTSIEGGAGTVLTPDLQKQFDRIERWAKSASDYSEQLHESNGN